MTNCEVIDLTLSDSGSAISVHTTSIFCIKFLYIKFLLQRKLFYRTHDVVVMYCSLAKSRGLICIVRSSVSFASRY